MKFTSSLISILLVSATIVMAQETNDAGASLTSHGLTPSSVQPFLTAPNGSMAMEVGGASNALFALVIGERLDSSLCLPVLNGECLDLDMGPSPIPLTVIFDGFSGSPFGQLSAVGAASFVFPATLFNGLTPAFQAYVLDPTNPPINASFTAAAEFEVSTVSMFQGDDVIVEYFFPSGLPLDFYGESFTSITVSTNGWIKLGGGCTFSDLSELNSDLFNGTIGGAPGGDPVVAAIWNDIDMGNNANQAVSIQEVMSGTTREIRVRWLNADLFPSTPVGTFEATLRSTGTIEIDHHALTAPLSGIVGISSGENVGGTTITNHDFYNGGFPPSQFLSTSFRDTIYRNYNVAGAESASTLYTLCFQAQNAFGSYDMTGVILLQSCL